MELSSGVTKGMNGSLHHRKWTPLPLDCPPFFFPLKFIYCFSSTFVHALQVERQDQ